MTGRPAAFMTYVRFDDQHDDGQLTRLRQLISAEVETQTGGEFAIFQDRNDIAWGQNWRRRIEDALDETTLLLVIVTPGLFRSPACRDEVARFLERERALGRDDLIVPIYYVSTPEFDDPVGRETDELALLLASRQYADWRELRFEPWTSPPARKAIAQLAARIRDSIQALPKSSRTQQSSERLIWPSISALESLSSIIRPAQPAAFLSYAPSGDPHEENAVMALSNYLGSETQLQTGEQFPIFQRLYGTLGALDWDARAEEDLSAATLLIPVITPAFFRSDACRTEVGRFLERERALGREDLILPIYYIDTPQMDRFAQRETDSLAGLLASRQYADWRELRFEPWTSPIVRKTLAQLAARIRGVISGGLYGTAPTETVPLTQIAPSTPMSSAALNRVFVSYSHEDYKYLVRLKTFLNPLERQGQLELWDDTKIQVGEKWRDQIRYAIGSCGVAILLISADFMASDFIQDDELPRILNEAQRQGLRIFSIIVGYCNFKDTALAQYQAVNDPRRPLMILSPAGRDAIFLEVYEIVKAALP